HRHISKDLWPSASGREARQRRILAEALSGGESAVVDNTNPTAAERRTIIDMARAHNARVVGYFFDVSTRAAVARNAARTGRERVPNVAIFTVAKRLQPPTIAEGYDELFRVEIGEDRALKVSPLSA